LAVFLIEPDMQKENRIPAKMHLSLQFENMLSLLFGKENYYGDIANMGNSEWKKNLLKIVKAIEKSVNQNINYTDEYQKTEFDNLIKQLKSKISLSNSINQTNHDTILGFTKLIFNLLGRFPYNWDKKNTSRKELWKLNEFRTLGYTQNFTQKANLIIHLSEYSNYNEGLPPKRELQKKLYMELKNNEVEFVEWFKKCYPNTYLKIF
jgi:hypothetical protein